MAEEKSISPTPAVMPKRKKSGVVIPNSPTFSQRIGAWIVWAALSSIAATLRYRVRDPHGFLKRKDISQAIYCIWHNRLALCMKLYFAFGKHRSESGMAGLVSASKDGAFLAAILQGLWHPARARFLVTSTRPQALLELKTWAERGYDLAITPDGPRGPRYVVLGRRDVARANHQPARCSRVVFFEMENPDKKLGRISNPAAILDLRNHRRENSPGAARHFGCRTRIVAATA